MTLLAHDTYGDDTARPPLLIVHGLFGSGRNWRVIAKRLSETRRAITPDMRNHGDSFRAGSQSYPEMAGDLAALIEHLGGRADVIGHSMGGKAAMVLALTRPEMVNRLVVADIAPVSYSHTQAHLVEAMRALDLSAIETRGDADRALSASVEDAGTRAFLLQSLDVKARRWRLNLDVLEADMGLITGFPEMDATFDGPSFFLAGGDSHYVTPEARPEIKRLFPNARQAKIPGAGHWLHAEKPREFEAAAAAFLDS